MGDFLHGPPVAVFGSIEEPLSIFNPDYRQSSNIDFMPEFNMVHEGFYYCNL